MGLLGPKLMLQLHSTGPYRGGDVIHGLVIVHLDKATDINNIDVMLRCTETVSALVSDYGLSTQQNLRSISNWKRHYSFRCTLFPNHMMRQGKEPAVAWSSYFMKPKNTWTVDFDKGYKLQAGNHEFPFQIRVPNDYPSTLQVSSSNHIKWAVTAKVFKRSLVTTSQDVSEEIEVYRHQSLVYDSRGDTHIADRVNVKIYLEGYKASTKSMSGFFSNIARKETEYKRKRELMWYVLVPNTMIVQDPHPINVGFGVEGGADVDKLILKSVKLKLRRTAIAIVYYRSGLSMRNQANRYEDSIEVYKRKDINEPLLKALERINSEVRNARVLGRQTDTYTTDHFEISYVLELEVVIASTGRPDHGQKLRMKFPVMMQSCMADMTQGNGDLAVHIMDPGREYLPVYQNVEPPPAHTPLQT